VPWIAAILLLAGGLAAGGFAAGRRALFVEARGPATTVDSPERSGVHPGADLPVEQLPLWVTDAVRNLEPDATIARALRESDTAYLVEIRWPGAQPPVTARVTGRFAAGRKVTLVRRVRDETRAGRGV
jgi:hypothetical protein